MVIKVTIDGLAAAIADTVKQYTEAVEAAVEKEVDDTANKVLEDIRDNSPVKTGKYKRGWRRTRQGRQRGVSRFVIHQKAKPNITHLLEFGHAKVGGGRVPAQPTDAGHIRPAYDRHVPGMEKRIKEIVRRGG